MKEKLKEKYVLSVLKLKNLAVNKKAEGYVDSGVKILIAIVIGGFLLTALYALFKDEIMKTVTERIQTMFSYSK